MIVADTSVLVAAFAGWHENHELASARLGSSADLVAHTATEFVSTLSRMPEPFRVGAAVAVEFLERRATGRWLVLGPDDTASSLRDAVAAGVSGGAIYDAMIAATAEAHDATLITLDRRAISTYRKLGADYELLTET